MKSIDCGTFITSLFITSLSILLIFIIWNEYRWHKLPDGRIYRLKHTCLSSHIDTYPVVQTNIDPNGNVSTTTVMQSSSVCDYELVDTVWRETK